MWYHSAQVEMLQLLVSRQKFPPESTPEFPIYKYSQGGGIRTREKGICRSRCKSDIVISCPGQKWITISGMHWLRQIPFSLVLLPPPSRFVTSLALLSMPARLTCYTPSFFPEAFYKKVQYIQFNIESIVMIFFRSMKSNHTFRICMQISG